MKTEELKSAAWAAAALSLVGLRLERFVTDNLTSPFRIDVRVLEEPQAELVSEQAPGGLVDAVLGYSTGFRQRHDVLGTGVSAKLIDSGFNCFRIALFE